MFVRQNKFLSLTSLLFIVLLFLPAPSTLLTLKAETEIAIVKIANAETASFYIPKGSIELLGDVDDANGISTTPTCIEKPIWVDPKQGAKIIYLKPPYDNLTIIVEGPANLGINGASVQIKNDGILRANIGASNKCGYPPHLRLPVNGLLEIGEEPSNIVEPDYIPLMMRDAKLLVFGRSVRRLFFIPLNFGPFEADAFYLADEFSLPPYSRIGETKRKVRGHMQSAFWWGYADVSFSNNNSPIAISASVNADEVYIHNLSLNEIKSRGMRIPKEDRISLSFSGRIFGDPNLRILYSFLIFMLIFKQSFKFKSRQKKNIKPIN